MKEAEKLAVEGDSWLNGRGRSTRWQKMLAEEKEDIRLVKENIGKVETKSLKRALESWLVRAQMRQRIFGNSAGSTRPSSKQFKADKAKGRYWDNGERTHRDGQSGKRKRERSDKGEKHCEPKRRFASHLSENDVAALREGVEAAGRQVLRSQREVEGGAGVLGPDFLDGL